MRFYPAQATFSLFIHLSFNVLVYRDLNVHYKDCLTSAGEIDRPGKRRYKFPNALALEP